MAEKFKVLYATRTGVKNGNPWKGLAIHATSEEDGKVYKKLIFSDDIDESQYTEAGQ